MTTPRNAPDDIDLLERAPARAWLAAALDEAWNNSGRAAAVMGEAGIGKTSLLRAFAAGHRRADDADVLWGACDPLATQRPLAPLADIARTFPWSDRLQDANRGPVFDALLRELTGARRRLAVVIEDVHWADEATLDLLVFLGRRITTTRALVVVSYRDDEIDAGHPLRPTLAEFVPRARQRLRLAPLSPDAVARLADGSDVDPDQLFKVTGGNPFFVTEAVAEHGSTVPLSVRDAVVARVERLSPTARHALEAVAVNPGSAEAWLVEAMCGATVECLDEGVQRGMLTSEGARLSFRHELARRAVLESIPPARRRDLHRRALAALEAAGDGMTDPARCAHHAEATDDAAAVLRHAPPAGARAAQLGAHREAARHYSVALSHAGTLDPAARAALAEHVSYQCYLTDNLTDAIAARRQALEIWRQSGDRLPEGDTLRWLSRMYWFAGRNAEARREAAAAVSLLESFPDTRQLAMAWSNMAQLEMLADHWPESLRWSDQAIALAEQLGDQDVLVHALNNRGVALLADRPAEGLPALERSLALALAGGMEEHAARAYTNLGSSLAVGRDYAEAERYLRAGIDYCAGRDLDSWLVYMTAWLARSRFEQGDWDEAVAAASWVIERPVVSPVSEVGALVVLGRVRARRGDPDVWPPLDRALELANETGELQRLGPTAAARAEAALLAGDPDRARSELEAVLPLAESHRHQWFTGELACLEARAGNRGATHEGAAPPFRLVLAGRGDEAAALWDRIGCPYEAADIRGESDDPVTVQRGHDALRALGAAARARQVSQRLRNMGVRVPRGPTQVTRNNPAELTDRELDVLRLLVAGKSNPEIAGALWISHKTVGHHVSHILAKLGARNRSEAAVLATSGDPPLVHA